MMKKGDVINGYVLTTDAQNGGGQCEWAFAEKDGDAFFIKRFLKPTYPTEGSPGSEQTKAKKLAESEEFDRQHREVMRKLGEISGEGGNLVVTRAFFREAAHYYKVTLKVDVSRIGLREIAALPRNDRILIMLTAAQSLQTLHRAGLVHGDVKPNNLLIKALPTGKHAIKVIDFDNCFPANHPAPADRLVGDLAYYSPELYLYHIGEGCGDVLDDKNDVFALGLVFWQYLTGEERPPVPSGKTYAAEAVLSGSVLSPPKSVRDVSVADVVQAMLAKEAANRPSMAEVHSSLKIARKSLPEGESAKLPLRRPARSADKPGIITGRLSRGHHADAVGRAVDDAGGKRMFTGTLFGRGAGTAMGFTPARDGDAPRTGAAESGTKITGTLPRKAATAPAEAPDSADATSAKIGGTLLGKTAAAADPPDGGDATGARAADGPEAVRGGERDILPTDEATTIEKPTVHSKLRSRLLKRRG